MRRPGAGLAAAIALAVWLTGCGNGGADGGSGNASAIAVAPAAPSLRASVLSSAANQVSGDDALVALDLSGTPAGTTPAVMLNGADVSAAFQPDPAHPGRYVGLVSGVVPGDNSLVASVPSAQATLHLTAYPISGPIIAGPHQQPFICETATFVLPNSSRLGPPLDADCTVAPRVDYLYLPAGGTSLLPMPDTTRLPDDVASTTTTLGVTVPFVVRLETRVIDRGVYQSTVLHDPTTEAAPTALAPPRGWNGGLIAGQGVGCAPGWYIQGTSQAGTNNSGIDVRVLSPARLGEGYALYGNTLMHGANNCNPVLVGEVSMMSKEQFVKTHGLPAFTVGIGCSGGSYTATQAADRMPGLYDGVLVQCNFPDGLSSSIAGSDARLLQHYFDVTAPAAISADQHAAVTGYNGDAALRAAALNANRVDPVPGRVDMAGYNPAFWSPDVPPALRYDPHTNPHGARPTVYDTARNFLGLDAATGFALNPYDNVGVQYGLQALNNGAITVQQFLDLNASIGGFDVDANYTAGRSQGNTDAIRRAYQSGMVLNGGGGLAAIPVMDLTGIYNDVSDYHQQWQHFAFRERLRHANGDLANMVMWRGNPVDANRALSVFFNWMRAYRTDTSAGSQRDKVIRNRPADAVDGCFSGSTFIAENLTLSSSPDTPCNTLLPSWTFPRLVAGGPLSADILKCTLKPLATADYAVAFTPAQWQQLQSIFGQGVCDWTKAGVGQVPLVPNASFGPAPLLQIFSLF